MMPKTCPKDECIHTIIYVVLVRGIKGLLSHSPATQEAVKTVHRSKPLESERSESKMQLFALPIYTLAYSI